MAKNTSNKENDFAAANSFGALRMEDSSDDNSDSEDELSRAVTFEDLKRLMVKKCDHLEKKCDDKGRRCDDLEKKCDDLKEEDVRKGRRISKLEADNATQQIITTSGEFATIIDKTHTSATLLAYPLTLGKEATDATFKVDSLYKIKKLGSYKGVLKEAKNENYAAIQVGDIQNVEIMIQVCKDISGERNSEAHKMTEKAFDATRKKARHSVMNSKPLQPLPFSPNIRNPHNSLNMIKTKRSLFLKSHTINTIKNITMDSKSKAHHALS